MIEYPGQVLHSPDSIQKWEVGIMISQFKRPDKKMSESEQCLNFEKLSLPIPFKWEEISGVILVCHCFELMQEMTPHSHNNMSNDIHSSKCK